jgi:hypothetical protein
MTTQKATTPDAALTITNLVAQHEANDFAAQVRAEYAKYIEKRDALRKSSGRIRRTGLQASLLS